MESGLGNAPSEMANQQQSHWKAHMAKLHYAIVKIR